MSTATETEIPTTRLSAVATSKLNQLQSLDFMKYLRCLALANGNAAPACEWYLEKYGDSFGAKYVKDEFKLVNPESPSYLYERAAAAAATTLDATWAKPLVGVEHFVDGFLAIARSASLFGRIPGLRQIPFNTRIPTEDTAANYAWVSQGAPKPTSQMAFGQGVTLAPLKSAAIVTFTAELIKLMTPGTEAAVRDTLIGGLTNFTDASFLSTAAAVTDTKPAGILNGLVAVTPGADFAASVAALLDAFFTARPAAQAVSLIASPRKAAQLRTLNAGAGPGYNIVESAAAGTAVIALDASAVFVADGGLSVDVSDKAAFEMNSTPSTPSAATVIVSLWQANLVGYLIERTLNWWAAPTSVAFLA